MRNNELLAEYQKLLLGNSARIGQSFFGYTKEAREANACFVLRYVVEELLEWSPECMRDHFNADIVQRYKLDRIITMISFPPEVNKHEDFFAYSSKLYPKICKLDFEALTISVYNKVHSGLLFKYPKGFFTGENGKERAAVCLRYLLTQKITAPSISELYRQFNDNKVKQFLAQWNLENAQIVNFVDPLDYLHYSLSIGDRDNFWYQYYRLSKTMPKFA